MNPGHIFQLIRLAVIYKGRDQDFLLVDICHVWGFTYQGLSLKQKKTYHRDRFLVAKKIKATSKRS